MDSGITLEHFELLERFGGNPWTRSAEQVAARERMREAYKATKAWAEALQARLFPDGWTEGRMAVINQGQHFSRYTWWRIYPRQSAPRELAYTVGIDRSGEFIVKIDTYQPPKSAREIYFAERGPTNAGSPFGSVLAAQEGVNLSFEALIEWSTAEIAKFDPSYDELARRLSLTRALRLLTDGDEVRRQLARWRDILLDGSIERSSGNWVPEGLFVMRPGHTEEGLIQTELGDDPTGKSWLVRINEAREPGSPNTLSAIATDANGRSYLLRQGMLRKNSEGDVGVSAAEFAARTGLKPVEVERSATGIERDWFLVAALDEGPELIRRVTADFVRACAVARRGTAAHRSAPPAGYRLGSDEKGGTYVIGPTGPVDERVVTRKQGIVWLALQERLLAKGMAIEKPGHPLGYEVDAAFVRQNGMSILVEIKTSASSNEVHTGVGQLHLYPALMPQLKSHMRVLLLPYFPHEELVSSIESLGITLAAYAIGESDSGYAVTFSEAFEELCGLA